VSEVSDAAFGNAIDAVKTIISCAKHQTRLIDDILTLSKLDSKLLLVTPVPVQPIRFLKDGIKVFEGEAQKADVKLTFRVDTSIQLLGLEGDDGSKPSSPSVYVLLSAVGQR